MKERPILFSAPMVRELLDGSKTQTRRSVKPQPPEHMNIVRNLGDVDWQFVNDAHMLADSASTWRCPYGQPGDRLWVRETWAHYQTVNHRRRHDGAAFSEVSDGLAGYRADGHETIEDFRQHIKIMSECDLENVVINGNRWLPSIHMPRWASRITLEVTGVRVERLQEISENDAWAEGCEGFDDDVSGGKSGYQEYAELWEQINSQGSCNANHWVWVIEFKRVVPA